MDLNTCLETTQDYRVIALYSHLIPIFITLIIGILVIKKSSFSILSKAFGIFITFFCLWLLGDLITWTANDYDLVSFWWAPLDYINILFYLFGAYFFTVLTRDLGAPWYLKLSLFILILPAWLITTLNKSIGEMYQPACEALGGDFIANYKLAVELVVIGFILFSALIYGLKSDKAKRFQLIVVSLALTLFFSVFSVSEYISSQSGIYEITLYSLIVMPVFLFMIIYSVTNLQIFKLQHIGFQVLAYALIIMVGSQFFFLQSATDKTLTGITLLMALGFGILLVKTGKKEVESREKIEKLATQLQRANSKLKEQDRQKDELLGIIAHQLATPVSSVRWNLEMMMDGDLGKLTKDQKENIQSLQGVTANLSDLVSMILDVSRIQLGRMKIDAQELDLSSFFKEILEVIQPKAKEKSINFVISIPKTFPKAFLDKRYTHMTMENLLSNAVKYTPEKGTVTLNVGVKNKILSCTVQDTGVGIPKEEQGKIFGKMFRASNVRNSIDGNGFGLYVAKGAIEAQGGRIWFKSEPGKGTTFSIELPLKGK